MAWTLQSAEKQRQIIKIFPLRERGGSQGRILGVSKVPVGHSVPKQGVPAICNTWTLPSAEKQSQMIKIFPLREREVGARGGH